MDQPWLAYAASAGSFSNRKIRKLFGSDTRSIAAMCVVAIPARWSAGISRGKRSEISPHKNRAERQKAHIRSN